MVQLLLSLMLIIGVVANVLTSCPEMCTCRIYPRDNMQKDTSYFTSVSCNSYISNISQSLDNTTRDIELRNFKGDELLQILNELSDNEEGLPGLTNLIIIRSGIDSLDSNVDAFERIRSLTLVDNGLDYVPGLFLNLSKLQSVDLSQNVIDSIEHAPFRTLHMLEELNLSVNALTNINNTSFSGLNVLKCLDLSQNNLTMLEDDVLLPLSSLQYLNLSNNRLKTLNEQCFSSLIMLQQLDVSWNRLARVAPGSLQLPSLARLLLAGNPQLGRSREVNVLVGAGRKLQTVDASRTGLKQVPAALTHSIRTLRLAGNSIRSVNCGDLDSYPLLQLLDFTANNLETIEDDSLGRLESLSILYLSYNNIHAIPQSLPEKLKVLNLEHNRIEKISDRDLLGLGTLEVLLLNDNKIRVVDDAAFSQLLSLVTLDLSRNPVTILQPGCLSGPPALQVLRLASIGIISPAEEVSFPLSTTEHLITLDLSGSPGLARQFLADTAALAASRELQELDLSDTDLEFIRSDVLHYLPQLRLLHIAKNRLNCTQMQWLASWLRRQVDREYKDIICASPAELWGVPLIDLQENEISSNKPVDTTIKSEILNMNKQYKIQSTNFIITPNITDQVSWNKFTNDQDASTNSSEKSKLHLYNKTSSDNHLENEVYTTNVKISSGKVWSDKTVTTKTTMANEITQQQSFRQVNEQTTLATTNKGRDIFNQNVEETTLADSEAGARQTSLASGRIIEPTASHDANETSKSHSNKSDRRTFISKISQNLFMTPKKNTSINNTSEKYKPTVTEPSIDILAEHHSWNASTGETSMYINNKQQEEGLLTHPSMIIMGTALMCTVAILAMLAARFTKTRRRRTSATCRQDDIEVSSMPSVTELW